jgi:hypothetical protein
MVEEMVEHSRAPWPGGGPTIRIPCGYGKLVYKALSKRLVANYDGEHGIAFVVRPPLFGIALSSYHIVWTGTERSPSAISIGFHVGAFAYRRARRELLTWAAVRLGSERFLAEWGNRQWREENNIPPPPSPVTEMLPEVSVLLEYDGDFVEVPYEVVRS